MAILEGYFVVQNKIANIYEVIFKIYLKSISLYNKCQN